MRPICLIVLVAISAAIGYGQDESLPVIVTPVVSSQVRSAYRVVGTVAPLRSSTIGSAVAGRVADFKVDVGQAVVERQPLAQLSTETLEIELSAARAELELYRQQLAELENGSREEDIAEAQAISQGARAAMENADKQLARLKALSTARAATEADLENASERSLFTRFAYAAAEATLKRVRQGPRTEQIAQAQAQVELQLQRARLIEDRISKHTILAPFDGFVAEEHIEVGAWIGTGDPIVQVIQLDQIEIQAAVTASQAVKLSRGDTVRVEFPELPNKLLTGTIDRIVPVAESRARTFPVFVRLANEIRDGAPLLLAGMLARVDLPAGPERTLPLVHKDALVLNQGKCAVFVVQVETRDGARVAGTVRKVPVELGVAFGNSIHVRGDIAAGDQVVVVGNERLQPGATVSAQVRAAESAVDNRTVVRTGVGSGS